MKGSILMSLLGGLGWSSLAAADEKGVALREDGKWLGLRMEVALTSQASAVGMTRIWCGDTLSGTLSASEAQASGTREAWCRDNPQEGFWTTEIAAAPVGLNLRLSGAHDWAWFGLGLNLSTAALSKAGVGAASEGDAGDVNISPLKTMSGLDFAFPLDMDGQRLHFIVGGGGMWLSDERNVRVRPFYGVAVLVDLLHIARPNESDPSLGSEKLDSETAEVRGDATSETTVDPGTVSPPATGTARPQGGVEPGAGENATELMEEE